MASLWYFVTALSTIAVAVVITISPATSNPGAGTLVSITGTAPNGVTGTTWTTTPGTITTAAGVATLDASGSHRMSGYDATGYITTPPYGDYSWIFPMIYVVYGFSITVLIITLATYTCCLKQQNNSNNVKHYVASFLVSILMNVVQEIVTIPEEFHYTLFCLFKLFMVIATHGWQIVMAIDVYLYVRYITKYNKFKRKMKKRNLYYHLCCWGSATVLTFIMYLIHTDLGTHCLNAKYTNIIFPTTEFIIIVINAALHYMTIRCHPVLRNDSHMDEKWIQLEKKVMVRQNLFMLTVLLWFFDTLCWILDINCLCESDLNITSNVDLLRQTKVVQAIVMFYILIFNAGILKDRGS